MEGEKQDNTSNNDGRKTGEQENLTVTQQTSANGASPQDGGDNPAVSTGNAWGWKDVAIGVAAGTAAVAATPVVLGAAGFTAGGVAAGSFAASVQSILYGSSVATGSVFAALQSAGVAGIGATASAAIGGVTGAAAVMVKKAGERWYSSDNVRAGLNDQDKHKEPENGMDKDGAKKNK